ncbi:PfkB family carbohydrate kinase [Lentibacter sp. XHP0401]|uniref:PfkB family carbohydrate kinase n=1 Tax=Lentibacter sp. XHP0401 TaxID=2984334 RepID=UPI0021E9553F|nr:PfkB family carbohydrate kinase [Lentibacter sp. XHP0401]MCV2892356.1 PfkB family carbohydrate kinase [Lentibacter sp. XHP0401]
MQRDAKEIICIGSVLWDIIGRSPREMRAGNDMPGRITRIPGGVAMNIAMTLARFGLRPVLLSALGRDAAGAELVKAGKDLGLVCDYIHFSQRPTDAYMAIEGANGLIAAIADAHSLEAAGDEILAPLFNGTLGSTQAPYSGPIALDGNLTEALLEQIALSPAFAAADLRVAPASPGKAERLRAVIAHQGATLYVNLEEAELISGARRLTTAHDGAKALLDAGARRVVVTHGANMACDTCNNDSHKAAPPRVIAARITGAGDTFMAAHIAAELQGKCRAEAIEFAQKTAATYVAGDDNYV